MKQLSLIFMGTPDFAVPALKALLEAGHSIKVVYTQPPRPVGRGHIPHLSPVHHFAVEHNLKVLTPSSLKSSEVQKEFAGFGADFGIVVAYGLILPREILEAPKHGCLNIHGSLLPHLRGAAPIQRAIEAGDSKTGVTLMKMDKGLDTGPMLLHKEINITPETTGKTLYDQLASMGAELLLVTLEGIMAGQITPQPQPSEGVTHAPKLLKEEACLDWRKPAQQLERQIRAFTPWPGSYFIWKGEKIKVLKAVCVSFPEPHAPGEILDDALSIACGTGALQLLELQRPGKTPLKARDFLNGMSLPKGMRLGVCDDSV